MEGLVGRARGAVGAARQGDVPDGEREARGRRLRARRCRHRTRTSNSAPISRACRRASSDGGQWTDGGGGSEGGSSSDAGAESSGRIRLAQAEERPSHRIELREHDGRNGGHAIAEHVGRSDAYLLARARGERGPALVRRRVGSFPSIEAANKLVSATLSSSKIRPGETLAMRSRWARGTW